MAEFFVKIMKHGLDAALVVQNALPDDATYEHASVDPQSGDVWLFVQSEAFDEVPEGEVVPIHPRVVFTRP